MICGFLEIKNSNRFLLFKGGYVSDLIVTFIINKIKQSKGEKQHETKNIIEEKQKVLQTLQSESSRALDIVISTINQLATVNEKIDVTISEINEAKTKLQSTEDDMNKTKLHNTKI